MKARCLPSNHSELAVSYCSIGLTHLSLKHYDEVIIYYTQNLSMSEKTLPSDHAEIGITHHNV
ncbi:unnamed protein product, partial [Rotaria magnacalcarata]